MASIIILSLSILAQGAATIAALRLIHATGRSRGWILISLGMLGMTVLQCWHFFVWLSQPGIAAVWPELLLGLFVSLAMFGGVLGIGRIFLEKTEAEKALKHLAEERRLLLKEVHHRIKNNLNTVMSFIRLQSDGHPSKEVHEQLDNVAARIRSMYVLYEKLYRSEGFTSLSARDYLAKLVADILDTFPGRETVRVQVEIADLILPVKELYLLGIMLNELLTNAMKYAFEPGQAGSVWVDFIQDGPRRTLSVRDNGKGLSEGQESGLGMVLVNSLAEQLDAELLVESGKGTRVSISYLE